MMPDLRRLFPTMRLWAGRGAVIRGHGDKRTLVGIQVNGAGDVLTLGRTDKSGVTPSLGTDEEPVRLRAGPGVRLHGYGGIHTLERLPVDEEVPTLKGTARLEWEVESSIGYATLCSLNVSFDSPGNWVVGWVQTNNNTLGSWVNTATASGVVRAWGGDETEPSECAEVVYTSTEDPEFDYGDYVSTEYSETLVAFEDIFPDAISAIEVLGEVASSGAEWPSKNWKDVSNGTIPFAASLGPVKVYHTDVFGEVPGANDGAVALSTRFRLRNAGNCPILVDYGFYGSGLPGGATDVDYSTTLGIGQTGDWITAPAIDLDPDKYRTAEIRRVRLSRWRSLP